MLDARGNRRVRRLGRFAHARCGKGVGWPSFLWPADRTSCFEPSEVLAEWMYEKVDHTASRRVDHTLRRLDLLSNQLQLKVVVLATRGDRPRMVVVATSLLQMRPRWSAKVPNTPVSTVLQPFVRFVLVSVSCD